MPDTQTPPSGRRVETLLVTGPSGAGRSTAINALEDLGYEVIDNLPLSLLPPLLGRGMRTPLALGLDVRNRDFSTDALIAAIDRLSDELGDAAQVLYLDAGDDTLERRYSETRRHHPLAPAGPPLEGITAEKTLLQPIRARADVLIDTSGLNIHQMREEVEQWFAPEGRHQLAVSVQSFSFKRGLPRSVDMVHDCRFLQNPYWEPALRPFDGTDARVADYVSRDPLFAPFAEKVLELSALLLPAYRDEGKSHIAIAFGCTGGQHRSVAVAERHALQLAEAGWQVSIRHRELDRQVSGIVL